MHRANEVLDCRRIFFVINGFIAGLCAMVTAGWELGGSTRYLGLAAPLGVPHKDTSPRTHQC